MSDNPTQNHQDNPTTDPQATPPDTPTDKQGGSEQTFTQADIDRIIADRLKRDRDAQEKKMLEGLGVQSASELQEMLEAKRKADEAQLSELEKVQKQLDKEREQRTEIEKQLADTQAKQLADGRKAIFSEAATASGGADVNQLFLLVSHELGDQFQSLFDEGSTQADEKQLKAFIKDVQGKFPRYFGVAGGGSPSNAGGVSPNANPTEEMEQMVRRKFGKL